MTVSTSIEQDGVEFDIRSYGSLIVEAYEYWASHFEQGATCSPTAFNPLFDKPHLVNSLALLSVSHDPLDITYRFIGPVILGITKRDLTGQSIFHSSYGALPRVALEEYADCAMTGRPKFTQTSIIDINGRTRRIDRVFLPIPAQEGHVQTIIAVVQPHADAGMDFIQRFMLANDI